MSYRRFKIAEFQIAPATLATTATVRAEDAQSVANVATVAGVPGDLRSPEAQSVAGVATVAGALRETAFSETPIQTDINRCWICARPEGDSYFIAVLSPRPGQHYWMHSVCHAEHRRREEARLAPVRQAAK